MATIQDKQKKKKKSRMAKTDETLTLKDVKTLGNQLLSSRTHLNNLPTLLSVLSPSSPLKFSLEVVISLESFFVPLVPEIPSKTSADSSKEKDPEAVYKAWLRARFDEFVSSLIEIAVDSRFDEALKVRIFLKGGFFLVLGLNLVGKFPLWLVGCGAGCDYGFCEAGKGGEVPIRYLPSITSSYCKFFLA